MKNKIKEAVEVFNDLYPVGTELIVKDDFGKKHIRKLKSQAWIVGRNKIVASFEGISGGYCIERIQHVQAYKLNFDMGITYLVPADASGTPMSQIHQELKKHCRIITNH
ncbi:MAG: hypothetical protein HRT69_17945 [Flavobacteriaceae bacterium]|nr:hypothetical protein [Flavobacteriaceae bacterium]